ncbi:hypothetical protein POVWA2_002400 [Plasmodium ovale wallikeri]|uniref:Uncharacterized protein n=1 Tax=Plasmodium ovale wallikeri TaxID=864142 RepID=A0A1A8YHU5_PLAOA|nr:hypothetical protein POVWA2_002400 [Plasmodium ovale wallikeri]
MRRALPTVAIAVLIYRFSFGAISLRYPCSCIYMRERGAVFFFFFFFRCASFGRLKHYAVRTELRNAKGHPSVHVGKPLSYSFVHRASAIFCSIIFKSKTNSVLPSPQKGMRAIKHFKVPKGIASPTLPRLRYCTCVTAPALPRLRYRAYVTASYSLLFFFFFLAIFPAYALRFTCIFRKTYPFLSEFSERILTLQGVPILRKKKKKNEGMGFFRPYSICTPNCAYHLLVQKGGYV